MENINGIAFHELEAEKFWTFPKSYKKDPKVETRELIFSGEYLGSVKMDGHYFRFIKDMNGEMSLQGRSKNVKGIYLNKIGHVPQLMEFFNSLPNGTCLLGEIYFPDCGGSHNVTTIMGCKEDTAIKRQKMGDELHYYIFDIWAYNGESYLDIRAMDRFEKIKELNFINSPYVELAEYVSGKELWELLQTTLAEDGEGIVMTKSSTNPEPGKRPARKTLKVKKELEETLDCFFTGRFSAPAKTYTGKEIETWTYWENIKTGQKIQGMAYNDYNNGAPIEPITKSYFNGWAGSLEIGVLKNGEVTPIGYISGLTEEIKANPKAQKGRVVEITAMEITEDEALRHGKIKNFRPDLTYKDCTWEKIFG